MKIRKETNTNIIEKQLEEYLRPRSPGANFVQELKTKLFFEPDITVEYPNYLYLILFICLSLLSGVIFYLGIRSFFDFFRNES